MLIYDCEIVHGIIGKNEKQLPMIKYAKGWTDYKGMGISTIGAYDYITDRYRVFCNDNLFEFQKLIDTRDLIIGFNSLSFDNPLCNEHGIKISEAKSYDILVEIWKGLGLSPKFSYPTHAGYGLDACVKANNPKLGKFGDGAMAPVDWQRGRYGSVIDYCLGDVYLTRELLELIIHNGGIKCPKTGKFINVASPI